MGVSDNSYGVHDIVGNVWEWCLDLYDANYYASSPTYNPVAGVNANEDFEMFLSNYLHVTTGRVLRGGTHFTSSEPIHTAARWGGNPINTNFHSSTLITSYMANIGFRCVWEPKHNS